MTQFARAYWRLDNWLGIEFLGTITWLLRIWRSIWLPINNPAGKHWRMLSRPLCACQSS